MFADFPLPALRGQPSRCFGRRTRFGLAGGRGFHPADSADAAPCLGVVGDEREVAAQLDHSGEFAALLEGGPDDGGGRFVDDEHAARMGSLRATSKHVRRHTARRRRPRPRLGAGVPASAYNPASQNPAGLYRAPIGAELSSAARICFARAFWLNGFCSTGALGTLASSFANAAPA